MLFVLAIGALCLALAACAVAYLQTRRLTESQRDQEKLERSSRVIEEERHVLEMIAKGCSLKEVLNALTAAIERMAPDCYCTVLLLDEEGKAALGRVGRRSAARVYARRQWAGNRPRSGRLRVGGFPERNHYY